MTARPVPDERDAPASPLPSATDMNFALSWLELFRDGESAPLTSLRDEVWVTASIAALRHLGAVNVCDSGDDDDSRAEVGQ
jgi:hypothetical protein